MQKCAIQAEVRWHTMPSNKREQESWGVYGRWTHECVTGYPNISNGWKLLFQQICKLCHQFSRKRSKCVTTTAPNCLILSFSFCEADVYVCVWESVCVFIYRWAKCVFVYALIWNFDCTMHIADAVVVVVIVVRMSLSVRNDAILLST